VKSRRIFLIGTGLVCVTVGVANALRGTLLGFVAALIGVLCCLYVLRILRNEQGVDRG
jgi:hypothetical protein